MDIDPKFGLPNETDVLEEIAKGRQKINVTTTARRYGKIITLVSGFDKSVDIKSIAKSLKEELACGGTVKGGIIELQGDHKRRVKEELIKLGFPMETIEA